MWEYEETHGSGRVECKTWRTQEKGTHRTKVLGDMEHKPYDVGTWET